MDRFNLYIAYVGLMLITSNLSGNVYVNMALGGLIETIGYLTGVFLMSRKWLGRRLVLSVSFVLCGVSLLLTLIVPSGTVEFVNYAKYKKVKNTCLLCSKQFVKNRVDLSEIKVVKAFRNVIFTSRQRTVRHISGSNRKTNDQYFICCNLRLPSWTISDFSAKLWNECMCYSWSNG